jgi:hypothetical protein
MHDLQISGRAAVLTPRQDRLEAAIVKALRANGTRSELRVLVDQLSGLFRMTGIPLERAIGAVQALGCRAAPDMLRQGSTVVGESPDDRIMMMVRWCSLRYLRGD